MWEASEQGVSGNEMEAVITAQKGKAQEMHRPKLPSQEDPEISLG